MRAWGNDGGSAWVLTIRPGNRAEELRPRIFANPAGDDQVGFMGGGRLGQRATSQARAVDMVGGPHGERGHAGVLRDLHGPAVPVDADGDHRRASHPGRRPAAPREQRTGARGQNHQPGLARWAERRAAAARASLVGVGPATGGVASPARRSPSASNMSRRPADRPGSPDRPGLVDRPGTRRESRPARFRMGRAAAGTRRRPGRVAVPMTRLPLTSSDGSSESVESATATGAVTAW